MRVAIGGFSHETNTYASGSTTSEDFQVWRGEEIVRDLGGTRLGVAGMLAAARDYEADAVPTFCASADPGAVIEEAVYLGLRDELVDSLVAAGPFDVIALEIHGAAVSAETRDVEGDLGACIRRRCPDAVLVAVADLHGNLTDAMLATFDLILPVELYPHVDIYERGREALSLARRILDGSLLATTSVQHLPMLLPSTTTDPGCPGHQLVELMHRIESRPGIVDCSIWHGFPFTDTADVGVHVAVTTNDDLESADHTAVEVGQWIWDRRDEFRVLAPSPEDAVAEALQIDGRPVVINETSDNPGGGAPGDGTHLLRALLDVGGPDVCFGFLCDPEVVRAAVDAGVGSTLRVSLGGKTDDLHGPPVELEAYVKCITDGRWTSRSILPGDTIGHGRMVRLISHGVDILVAEERGQTFEPEIFLMHGIDVADYRIVGLKGSNHFRAAFAPISAGLITADSPGLTTLRPEFFEHRNAPYPLWPVDAAADYAPPGPVGGLPLDPTKETHV